MPSEMIWRTRLASALKASGIEEWPHNAPRHSFASYHLAAFKDSAALALEMGHGSTKMIFEHYRALVTPKKGKAFWSIVPVTDIKISQIKTA
jgi:integrase